MDVALAELEGKEGRLGGGVDCTQEGTVPPVGISLEVGSDPEVDIGPDEDTVLEADIPGLVPFAAVDKDILVDSPGKTDPVVVHQCGRVEELHSGQSRSIDQPPIRFRPQKQSSKYPLHA